MQHIEHAVHGRRVLGVMLGWRQTVCLRGQVGRPPVTWLELKEPEREEGVDGGTGRHAGELRRVSSLPRRTKRTWMKGFLISKPTWRPKGQRWARPLSSSLSMPCPSFPTPGPTRPLKSSSRWVTASNLLCRSGRALWLRLVYAAGFSMMLEKTKICLCSILRIFR